MRPPCRRRAPQSGLTATDKLASKRAFLLAGPTCCLQGGCLAVARQPPSSPRCRHEPNLSRRRSCDRVRPGVVQSRPGSLRRKDVQRRAVPSRSKGCAHSLGKRGGLTDPPCPAAGLIVVALVKKQRL